MAEIEEVGDSSLDILRNVQREAKELLRIALQCRVGAERPGNAGATGEEEIPLLVRLKREKEGLIREFVETKVEHRLREQLVSDPLANVSISEGTVEDLQESNQALERDLLSVKLQYLQDRRILESLQASQFLTEQLFPAASGEENNRSLGSLVDKHTALCSDVLRNVHELNVMQSELETLRRERSEVQRTCRQLMAQLEDLRKQDPVDCSDMDSHEQSLRERLDRLSAEATLRRHTLQSLVVGSGADWSEGELLELVLRLGKKFDWQ